MDELRDPSTLRIGSISKKVDDVRYVVKAKKDGKHYWAKATKPDIQCARYLSKKVKKLLREFYKKKTSRLQSKEQALAVAYSMTAEKFPKCSAVSQAPGAKATSTKVKKSATKAKKPTTKKVSKTKKAKKTVLKKK